MTVIDAELDQRIMTAIQQGDRKAFAELYDRHCSWLMAVAYRILNNHNDAEDLIHDVFIEIWKTASGYDASRGTVSCWLAVKTRSRALDRLRSLKTVKKHIVEQAVLQTDSIPTSKEVSRCVDHALARNMLAQLSPAQQTVIEFSYFRGFTCQEIANYCEMPLGTVKSGLLRAIQVLRKEITKSKVGKRCM